MAEYYRNPELANFMTDSNADEMQQLAGMVCGGMPELMVLACGCIQS